MQKATLFIPLSFIFYNFVVQITKLQKHYKDNFDYLFTMRKLFLSFLLAGILSPLAAHAIDDGTYYLYNVGAKRYLNFGGTDGYTAAFLQYGAPLKIEASGESYKIGGTHYDANSYLNATGAGKTSAALFTITETAEGTGLFTIQSTNGYFGYDAAKESSLMSGTTVATALSADAGDNVHWQLLTRSQLVQRLSSATEESPVDATFYVSCPGFNRHEVGIAENKGAEDYWEWTEANYASSYYNPNQVAHHISGDAGSTCEFKQTLTGVKPGKYRMTCQGFYRAGSNTVAYNSHTDGSYPYNALMYADDVTAPIQSIYVDGQKSSAIYDAGKKTNSSWDWTNYTQKGGLYYPYYSNGNTYSVSSACVAFDNALYQARDGYNTLNFTVGSSGSVTIGFRTTASLAYDWLAIDNIHLEYLGEVSEEEKAKELQDAKDAALQTIASTYEGMDTKVQAGELLTAYLQALAEAKATINAASDVVTIESAMNNLDQAYRTLLRSAEPLDGQQLDFTVFVNNPSFETGDMTGWVYTALVGADAGAKANSDGVYTVKGCAGNYLFNTWVSSDGYVADGQDHCVYQTVKNLREGEYVLKAKEASNTGKTSVTLFANHFTKDIVPASKTSFNQVTLDKIYVTSDVRSLTLGVRSASWFKADDFVLLYKGKTADYEAYAAAQYADACLTAPVLFDNFDGQSAIGFTYAEIGGHTHGGFPLTTGGEQKDGSLVDRSVLQDWTGTSYQLGKATISTSYSQLPTGYYKVSAQVRVYDQNGDYDGTATGLWLYANDRQVPITTGTSITQGNLSGSGFYGDYSVVLKVTDGTLQTGLRLDGASMNWVGFQGFSLEYLGTSDPMAELAQLDAAVGSYAAVCLPFDLKPDFFGPLYTVAQVSDGKALILPVSSVAAGTPCVVKVTDAHPSLTVDDVVLNFGSAQRVLNLWDNTLITGDADSRTWTATLVDDKQVKATDLTFEEVDVENIDVTMTVENRAVQRFIKGCKYTTSSTTSVVANYNEAPPARRDQPKSFLLPMSDGNSIEITNMIPGQTYTFDQTDANGKHYAGRVTAEGKVRMINAGHVINVRDLGGWTTLTGKVLRYGRLYRGGQLNGTYSTATAADVQTLKELGIGGEIDLRWKDGYDKDDQVGVSAFGFTEGDDFYVARANDYTAANLSETETQARLKAEFKFIIQCLEADKAVYYHCAWGADRTGLLTFLLEGVLGMSQPDLYRDYELTSFSAAGNRLFTSFQDRIKVITSLTGASLTKKFENYFKNKLGVSADDISTFRSLMLNEKTPIDDIEGDTLSQDEAIYDLTGRRLPHLQRGINIVGGKKVVVK